MMMASPVRGLRPWRSFLSFTTKLPNPRRSTRSFPWSASAIIARTESTATSTSDFFNSVLAATFSINCCFVILFEFSGSWSPNQQLAGPGTGSSPLRWFGGGSVEEAVRPARETFATRTGGALRVWCSKSRYQQTRRTPNLTVGQQPILMGTGEWLRGQTEHCLLAARGQPL